MVVLFSLDPNVNNHVKGVQTFGFQIFQIYLMF